MKLLQRLRLTPEVQAELTVVALGTVATWAVQELTGWALQLHNQAHAADDEVTRLQAANDQLAAHNEHLEHWWNLERERSDKYKNRVAELTEANELVLAEIDRLRRKLPLPVDTDELLPPHHD